MHTAICAFDDKERAKEALDRLLQAGFARHDLHLEHRHVTSEGRPGGTDRWDGMEREVAVDRGTLASFGNFFASLLGRDHPSGHVDTYSDHVERGGYVLVADARDEAEAQRAQALMHELQAGDVNVLHRPEQQPLREVVGLRDGTAGMVERSREPYEGAGTATMGTPMARERAMAANRVDPIGGPALRDPEVEQPPGLRYADQDKPRS